MILIIKMSTEKKSLKNDHNEDVGGCNFRAKVTQKKS